MHRSIYRIKMPLDRLNRTCIIHNRAIHMTTTGIESHGRTPPRHLRSPHLCMQRRHFLPLVAAGVGVILAGTIYRYTMRALAEMERRKDEESFDFAVNEAGGTISGVVGFDLGTSYAKVSVYHSDDADNLYPDLVENREGRRVISSCIHYDKIDEKFQLGHLAKSVRYSRPQDTVYALSHLLGAQHTPEMRRTILSTLSYNDGSNSSFSGEETISFTFTDEDKTVLRPEEMVGMLAGELFTAAKAKHAESLSGDAPAVVACPNYFSAQAKKSLADALRKQGINALDELVIEDSILSVYGAVSLAQHQKLKNKLELHDAPATVLVVDVGGKLTQLALLHIDPGEGYKLSVELLDQHTEFVGSESFDHALVMHCSEKFGRENGGKINLLADPQAKQRLYDAAESCKKQLASTKSSAINVPFITAGPEGPLHLDYTISRASLERLVERDSEILRDSLKSLLFNPKSKAKAPLRGVLLVGGGSRLPHIKALVNQVGGGIDVITVTEPESVAAIGAASFFSHVNL